MFRSLINVLLQVLISVCACSPSFLELLKQDDKEPSTFRLAYECMNEEDTKLRLYGVMLAKVCLEKDPYVLGSVHTRSLPFYLLHTFVESEGDERVEAEALAAIHIVIKHNVEVGYIYTALLFSIYPDTVKKIPRLSISY